MMTAAIFSTPNHKMAVGHRYAGDITPSRLNDSFLQKVVYSTPNNFEFSTPITPSSVAHTSASKYVNMGIIGEGSYGLVLKCKERQTGRIVAIKKFIESEEDKSVRKIAMREIHLLKQLRHENLVNLLEVFRRKCRLYLVFEFVEKSLLDHLELSPNGLERGQCRRILYQVIRALEFCHIHNIIHRDVKPENILISKHGVVKLCDFGFARTLAKPGEAYTEYVSTRWYRAPELLVGDARYGRSVDIWALGCLSAEMMTGQPLFPGDSDIDQLFSIVKCFGGLCRKHEERLYCNPMFRFEISQIEVSEPLKCRIRGCTSGEFQFVSSCLELDPQDRPTCSALMRHPLFTCDGFTSWFSEELEDMLRRDASGHVQIETLKPKRLLPDLKKCILINSSTPIKGDSTQPINFFAHSDLQEKVGMIHRNLEKAFGLCVEDNDVDEKPLHNDSGHDDDDDRFNFDIRLHDINDIRPENNSISDLDLSFSHLGIREGVELEGEEFSRKDINDDNDVQENDDDYREADVANNCYNCARVDDGHDDYSNMKQYPLSVQPVSHNIDNNNRTQSSTKTKSPSSSSSAKTSLTSSPSSSATSKSSASTSGVSSSSSSSTSSLLRGLNSSHIHHHHHQKNNLENAPKNYNNYYYNNYNYQDRAGALNNPHKSSFDATHKNQIQKLPHQSTSKNIKHNYKSQQHNQTRTQHQPLQPIHQKNNMQEHKHRQKDNINEHKHQQKDNIQEYKHQQKQPHRQQQHHCKQSENESPKTVQRQQFQNPQKQQNFQSKPAKKKSNSSDVVCKPSQKQFVPKSTTNQAKIGFKQG